MVSEHPLLSHGVLLTNSGICVAVAVIPESLIAVLTITLAIGIKVSDFFDFFHCYLKVYLTFF